MLETIYITRHGFRGNWANTKWSPSPTGIDADPALASHGVEQSIELAQHLRSIKPKIERIYCSPFYRCLQTIQYTAKALELPIMVDHGIGEWYGITRDTHPSPAGLPMLKGFFPEIDTEYKASLVPSNKGETMADIHDRVARAIKIIIADAEAHGCKAIVLCTHAATNIALGRALMQEPERVVHTGTCSLAKYSRTSSTSAWQCELNGDCSFLKEGEERNWYFHTEIQLMIRWFDGDIPIYESATESARSSSKL